MFLFDFTGVRAVSHDRFYQKSNANACSMPNSLNLSVLMQL